MLNKPFGLNNCEIRGDSWEGAVKREPRLCTHVRLWPAMHDFSSSFNYFSCFDSMAPPLFLIESIDIYLDVQLKAGYFVAWYCEFFVFFEF